MYIHNFSVHIICLNLWGRVSRDIELTGRPEPPTINSSPESLYSQVCTESLVTEGFYVQVGRASDLNPVGSGFSTRIQDLDLSTNFKKNMTEDCKKMKKATMSYYHHHHKIDGNFSWRWFWIRDLDPVFFWNRIRSIWDRIQNPTR